MLQHDLEIPAGQSSPRPLFVHSNLLKHIGGGLARGEVYTHIKHMALDKASEESLNYVRMFVYQGPTRGMCIEMHLIGAAEDGLSDAQKAVQKPVVEAVVDNRDFDGFEASWWDEGGKVGGWFV